MLCSREKTLIKNSANAILFLGFSLCAILGGCNFVSVRGADTPERVVEQYILGLEQQKENVILQLIPKEYVAEQAVEDKISQFGGHEVEEYSVVYNEIKPVFLIAEIKGSYVSNDQGLENFEDQVTIAYRGAGTLLSKKANWYLLLGDGQVPSPDVSPAEPQDTPPK